MNKKSNWPRRLVPVLQILICSLTHAQEADSPRINGLAGAGITLSDHWSVLNNPAGIANENQFAAGAGVQRNYLLRELDKEYFSMVFPLKTIGVAGLAFSQYGYTLYKQQQLSLCWSRSLARLIAFGFTVNYNQIQIGEGYGKKNLVKFKAGFQYSLTRELHLAATIHNPLRSKLSDFNDERTPAVFSMGLSYDFSKKLKIIAEGNHGSDIPVLFRGGLEYLPYPNFILRGGLCGAPLTGAFGFGFIRKKMQFEISVSHHPQLGYSPSVSISYKAEKKQ
jgi:hypothetical protein